MQIGPAVSQAIGISRELHGNYRSAVSGAVSVTIGRFLIYGTACVLTLNSINFPSYTLFFVNCGYK